MDIQKITAELIATGLTQEALASLANCSQPTISAFLKGSRGARPSLAIGKRLLELHHDRVIAVDGSERSRRKDDKSPASSTEQR
ncbi:helix-turn-helix domain-containing protein [Massilia sp. BKSP1R2A-1]|uniref:helix-turn-helix domain-containing protein n=1 Tax=Massilia sp. BKSP1R2A-1 TaxID=3422595 RepID=UPI003D33236E